MNDEFDDCVGDDWFVINDSVFKGCKVNLNKNIMMSAVAYWELSELMEDQLVGLTDCQYFQYKPNNDSPTLYYFVGEKKMLA